MASSLKLSSPTPFFLLFLLTITIPFSWGYGDLGPEKETHMHFFFHENNSGPNRTAFVVTTLNTPNRFGDIVFVDDMLREGPDPYSKLIGRAQGVVNHVALEEAAYLITLNFIFTEGEYNGSTLAVYGRAVFESTERNWLIIGGTGQFWLARGYALGTKLISTAASLLIELDVTVWAPVLPQPLPRGNSYSGGLGLGLYL